MSEGTKRKGGPASVRIAGLHGLDERELKRRLAVRVDDLLTPDEARQLASQLLAGADEIERLDAE
jgi:hypothetical protein